MKEICVVLAQCLVKLAQKTTHQALSNAFAGISKKSLRLLDYSLKCLKYSTSGVVTSFLGSATGKDPHSPIVTPEVAPPVQTPKPSSHFEAWHVQSVKKAHQCSRAVKLSCYILFKTGKETDVSFQALWPYGSTMLKTFQDDPKLARVTLQALKPRRLSCFVATENKHRILKIEDAKDWEAVTHLLLPLIIHVLNFLFGLTECQQMV